MKIPQRADLSMVGACVYVVTDKKDFKGPDSCGLQKAGSFLF